MTEDELRRTFDEFNAVYFNNKLTCEMTLTENWTDLEITMRTPR
jgi:hypothetical protein